MATIKDVADRAKVSITTVSRVLNNDQGMVVSEEKRRSIFEAALDLNFIPRNQRHADKTKKIIIGIADWRIIESSQNYIKLTSLQYLASIIDMDHEIEFVRFQYLDDVKFNGVLALGTFNEEEILYLNQVSFNIVFINSDVQDYNYNRINVDIADGFKKAIQLFIDKDWKKIGYVGGLITIRENVVIGSKRIKSLTTALVEQNLYNADYFKICGVSEESGYQCGLDIAKSSNHADVYIIGNDLCAKGVMKAFKEEKVKNIHLVLYKDLETVDLDDNKISIIHIYHDAIWKEAIALVLDLMFKREEINKIIHLPIQIELK